MSTKYNTPFVQKPDKGTLKATQTKYNDKSPDYYGDIHVNLKDCLLYTSPSPRDS